MDISNEFEGKTIAGAATTTIFSGRGTLGLLTICTTANGTITVKDGTDVIAEFAANAVVGTYNFNRRINNGLSVVTAASPSIVVTYRQ